MKLFKTIKISKKQFILIAALITVPLLINGQPEHPPRPVAISVSVLQNLNFGTFYHYNTGGTVVVSPTGSRSSTGDVVLFNGTVYAGLFTVTGNIGTVVSFIIPDAFIFSGANSIRLSDFVTDPLIVVLPNTSNPASKDVTVGATLNVGESFNPAGNYSGTFSITVIQE